jgi:hypothetical protein
MKITDLVEEQQDEGIGSAIGKVAGGIGNAVGGAIGGAKAIGSAAKAGYQAGSARAQQSILGQTPPAGAQTGGTAPATVAADPAGAQTGGTAPATGATAGNATKGTADFGTIQRSIKSLSPNQKKALAGQLAGKAPATPAPGAPAAPVTTPPAATAPTGPQKGQEVALASGEKYRFLGQQWVEVDPTTGAEVGGAALPAGFQKSLNGIAAKQQAAPASGTPDLKVVDGGKAAVAEGFYYRSKFLNIIL